MACQGRQPPKAGAEGPPLPGHATQPYSATEVDGCHLRGSILRRLYADSHRR